jgi:Pectate lyase superfamily protein
MVMPVSILARPKKYDPARCRTVAWILKKNPKLPSIGPGGGIGTQLLRQRHLRGRQLSRDLLRIVAFAFGLGVALPAWAQAISGSTLTITGPSTLEGDVVMCSGRPWLDVRCNGATGDGVHDDTAAIETTVSAAIANGWPVHIPAGTYKVTSPITRLAEELLAIR